MPENFNLFDDEDDIFDFDDSDGDDGGGSIQPGGLFGDLLQEFATGVSPESSSKDDANWKPLPGPQEMAFYSTAYETLYGGAAGGGKGHANSSEIQTLTGTIKMGDIKLGDQIAHPLGGATRVIGVYPLGERDIYKVTFVDGSSTMVTDDHLWVFRRTRKKSKKSYLDGFGRMGTDIEQWMYWYLRSSVGTTLAIKKLVDEQNAVRGTSGDKGHNIVIPLTMPVQFTRTKNRFVSPNWIDPYLLGLLIGDGNILTSGSLSIGSADEEIHDFLKSLFGSDVIRRDISSYIIGESRVLLKEQLEFWGLAGKSSWEKHVPDAYKYGAIDERIALMQGLIDTDGYVDDRGHVSYTTTSEQLAKDVQWVSRSLGCKATITEKQGAYTKDGERVECRMAYTVWIQGVITDRFARLARKKANMKAYNGGSSYPARMIESIEFSHREEATCIKVDNPIPLYIANDFIVTHNTDLMVGLVSSTLSPHKKAIVFRSTYPEHKDFIERVRQVAPESIYKGGNAQKFENLPGGKTLELGSVANFSAAQKYRGRPHDLKLFDELPKMPEEVYTFLIGWARTAEKNVPVRIVSAGNPPTSADEEWVIRRWRCWLDPEHPNPAEDGEIRWFATLDGEDTEITPELSEPGSRGESFEYIQADGRPLVVKPSSRTFIAARLTDNPYLMATNYEQVLQNMPEPYRSQLLEGKFVRNTDNDIWRVIPVHWVDMAFDRWDKLNADGEVQRNRKANVAYGLDVAEGGQDASVHTKMTGSIVQWQQEHNIDDTMVLAHVVFEGMKDSPRAPVGVDAIGVGLGVAQRLKQMGKRVLTIKGSRKSKKRDSSGTYGFYNKRSEMWWALREALDPDGETPLALPRSRKLKEELTAIRYEIVVRGNDDLVRVDSKDEVKKRLRRSPDFANSLMYAFYTQRSGKQDLRIF